jgi:hypothetical protein
MLYFHCASTSHSFHNFNERFVSEFALDCSPCNVHVLNLYCILKTLTCDEELYCVQSTENIFLLEMKQGYGGFIKDEYCS